jgi:hypothetical protein
VHRSTWSLLERGHLDRMNLAMLRRCLAVLEIRLDLVPSWRGTDLSRLRDSTHADLQAAWKRRLERWGWQVWAEYSFNHYGDRGRIDLLAWHPRLRALLIVEIKSEIDDVQALLGGMDVKCRVAPIVARRLGIGAVAAVIPFLVVADGSTARDRLRRLAPLFSRFDMRGRAGVSWLRRPDNVPSGLLALTDLRFATGSSVKPVGAHRVRRPGSTPSVNPGASAASPHDGPT